MFVAAVAVIVHFRAAKIFARAYAAFLALVLNHVGKYIAHLLWLFYALYVHFRRGAVRRAEMYCAKAQYPLAKGPVQRYVHYSVKAYLLFLAAEKTRFYYQLFFGKFIAGKAPWKAKERALSVFPYRVCHYGIPP